MIDIKNVRNGGGGQGIYIYKNFTRTWLGQVIFFLKVKVKSSMAKSLPVENILPQNVGSIINYLQ